MGLQPTLKHWSLLPQSPLQNPGSTHSYLHRWYTNRITLDFWNVTLVIQQKERRIKGITFWANKKVTGEIVLFEIKVIIGKFSKLFSSLVHHPLSRLHLLLLQFSFQIQNNPLDQVFNQGYERKITVFKGNSSSSSSPQLLLRIAWEKDTGGHNTTTNLIMSKPINLGLDGTILNLCSHPACISLEKIPSL